MTEVPERHSAAEKAYFGWVASLPCAVTGRSPVQVAHLRHADAWYDKPLAGVGRKPSIPYVLPLVPEIHLAQEASNKNWWHTQGFPHEPAHTSPLALCWILWRIYCAHVDKEHAREVAARIILSWRDVPVVGAG